VRIVISRLIKVLVIPEIDLVLKKIIIKFKTLNLVLPGVLVVLLALPLVGRAGIFDQLLNAADEALVTYGRDAVAVGRDDLPVDVVSAGLREVLLLGSDTVGNRLSRDNAYAGDAVIRISLPEAWDEAREIAARIGYQSEFDELEQRLNRAAEATAPATRDYLQQAIERLDLENAREILKAGDTAATAHLRRSVAAEIRRALRPHIEDSLQSNGASGQSNKISRRIARLPMVRALGVDLADHVVELSLDGFFHYLRKEEQIIRRDPARHSTDTLKKLFG